MCVYIYIYVCIYIYIYIYHNSIAVSYHSIQASKRSKQWGVQIPVVGDSDLDMAEIWQSSQGPNRIFRIKQWTTDRTCTVNIHKLRILGSEGLLKHIADSKGWNS